MSKEELISLIEDFKNGDSDKFEKIYLATNKKLYNYIFSLSDSLNDDDCYELLQETYIQVNNKIDTLKECKAFYSWTCTIARNKTLRYLEKKKKEYLLSEDDQSIFENQYEIDEDLLPEEVLDSKEKRRMILNILNSLPEEQREVILLRYYNGLSVKEIASNLNVSDGTVKSRLNYGRKKIELEVVELEKKGTKLHCTSLPLILLLLRQALGGGEVSQLKEQNLFNSIVGSEKFISHNYDTLNKERASKSNNSIDNRGFKDSRGKWLQKTAYTKFITGGVVICLLGGGVFVYRSSIKNNDKVPVAIEGNDINVEEVQVTQNNLDEVRFEISSYEIDVINIYERVKFNNFMGKDSGDLWEMDNFISKIQLVSYAEENVYYESTYSIWANDIIVSLIDELESIIEKKQEVSLLKDLNKEEKELISDLEGKISYFINNQNKFNELNDKLSLVISHGSSDGAVEAAVEFKRNFTKYEKLLDKLKE